MCKDRLAELKALAEKHGVELVDAYQLELLLADIIAGFAPIVQFARDLVGGCCAILAQPEVRKLLEQMREIESSHEQ